MEVPPAVVVDAHDVCPQLDQAQTALHEALGGSMAPEPGWRLRVYDERRGVHVIVTAHLDDAQGNAVAHREIDTAASDHCDGVISALGIWAALVLDAETAKAKAHPRPVVVAARTDATVASRGVSADGRASGNGAGAGTRGGSMQPTGVDSTLNPPHTRTVEVGASGTLMNSPLALPAGAALVGGDAFVNVEVYRSFFLRPSIGASTSLSGPATYAQTRVDACLRIPGNYVEHRGLLLDTCAGTEIAVLDHTENMVHATDAVFSLGPTIGLRGDLASDLSIEVRGLAAFNIIHTSDQIGLLSMRAELGFTWRLR